MNVLNLYAGVGGNRKLWNNCQITAVESDEKIARVYANNFPNDEVIVADAHEFLRLNFERFEFIWSSPPCQSHSRFTRSGRNRKPRFPDMQLYEEIIFLKHNFKGLWVVENVKPYYSTLIPATKLGRHLFWSNFKINPNFKPPSFKNMMNRQNKKVAEEMKSWLGFDYPETLYVSGNNCTTQVLRNCVHPETGLFIFNCAIAEIFFRSNM